MHTQILTNTEKAMSYPINNWGTKKHSWQGSYIGDYLLYIFFYFFIFQSQNNSAIVDILQRLGLSSLLVLLLYFSISKILCLFFTRNIVSWRCTLRADHLDLACPRPWIQFPNHQIKKK